MFVRTGYPIQLYSHSHYHQDSTLYLAICYSCVAAATAPHSDPRMDGRVPLSSADRQLLSLTLGSPNVDGCLLGHTVAHAGHSPASLAPSAAPAFLAASSVAVTVALPLVAPCFPARVADHGAFSSPPIGVCPSSQTCCAVCSPGVAHHSEEPPARSRVTGSSGSYPWPTERARLRYSVA